MERIKQKCGDILIIEGKSSKKIRNRYYYEGHFEGYNQKLTFRLDSAKCGDVANPYKPDKYGFICNKITDKHVYFVWKDMERRCYYPEYPEYKYYGNLGVKVSDEFKDYSKFKIWYDNHNTKDIEMEMDKDCLSYIKGISKIYSPDTCILIPPEINTFISTIGKGIYKTKYNTYCVRIRRVYTKINKNFKSIESAIKYKKEEDLKYLKILLNKYNLDDSTIKILEKYVKICRYSSNI